MRMKLHPQSWIPDDDWSEDGDDVRDEERENTLFGSEVEKERGRKKER